MKGFDEALKDGFTHIEEVTDPEELKKLRDEGVLIDSEGYWSFLFGPNQEFELRLEPILEEDVFYIALYENNHLKTEKLPVKVFRRVDNPTP